MGAPSLEFRPVTVNPCRAFGTVLFPPHTALFPFPGSRVRAGGQPGQILWQGGAYWDGKDGRSSRCKPVWSLAQEAREIRGRGSL